MKKLILFSVLVFGAGNLMAEGPLAVLQKKLLNNPNTLLELVNLVHDCKDAHKVVYNCGLNQKCYTESSNLNLIIKGLFGYSTSCESLYNFVIRTSASS